jgi:pyrophosphatase PpaX
MALNTAIPPTVLFDLDGTLIDTVDLIVTSFQHTFQALLPSHPATREVICAYLGDPLQVTFERLVGGDASLVTQLLTTYRAFNHAQHDALVKEVPGMKDAVAALAAAGCRLAVVTSKTTALAEHGLDVMGLRPFFPVVVGVDACAEHKPHPAPALEALRRLGVPPGGRVVFVGDAPADILCGRAAGCAATVAVEWTALERGAVEAAAPTHWVRDAQAMKALLLELCGVAA